MLLHLHRLSHGTLPPPPPPPALAGPCDGGEGAAGAGVRRGVAPRAQVPAQGRPCASCISPCIVHVSHICLALSISVPCLIYLCASCISAQRKGGPCMRTPGRSRASPMCRYVAYLSCLILSCLIYFHIYLKYHIFVLSFNICVAAGARGRGGPADGQIRTHRAGGGGEGVCVCVWLWLCAYQI